MKGLKKIPSVKEISEAYKRLFEYSNQGNKGESKLEYRSLVLYSQWIRFDPRLAEILATFLAGEWRKINPMKLNSILLKAPWSSVFGVLIETAKLQVETKYISMFNSWADLVMAKVPPASPQFLFFGLFPLGSKRAQREAELFLPIYLKWGYLCGELLVNKEKKFLSTDQTRTFYNSEQRKNILKELLEERSQITVHDYLEALNFRVSKRVAQLDLANAKMLKRQGYTKGRIYIRSKALI